MYLANYLVLAIVLVCAPLANAQDVFSSSLLYDWGFYGLFPRTWYKSFSLASPLLNFLSWDTRCDDGYYLLSPRGSYVWNPGPVILDSRGNLVWASDRFGMVTDVKTQTYKGREYLTFWKGKDGVLHGYGNGHYVMLDETYHIFKVIRPIGDGYTGDLHEFKITDQDTALMTIYHPIPADLSSIGGPKEGWILDSIFQEIDIENSTLLFEWRASDHVPISHTDHPYPSKDNGLSPRFAFDYFHINSIDKDMQGNYVISSRHTNTIMSISPTGKTLWTWGGVHNMFKDLSDNRATDFMYQHHARLHGNNTISLFDNAKSEKGSGPYSRGMLVTLDTKEMTATLEQEYLDPAAELSASQGSMQVLEDTGNVLIGYGFLPSFTEMSPDGQVLCDARFAPWIISNIGMVTSYRAFKSTRWIGKPTTPPSIYLQPSEGTVYSSWNGATLVRSWVLQGADWDGVRENNYEDLISQEKEGFEVAFDIEDRMPRFLRVVALDAKGEILGHTELLNREVGNAPSAWLADTVAAVVLFLLVTLAAIIRRRTILRYWRASSLRRMLGLDHVSLTLKDWRRRWTGHKNVELEPLYHE
ncbi:Arylsulfotransferase-domain-containing protein [Xylariaceae sp. FL0255]|nr:Arylsulfotransferase-domain-containing protein [Xylariaceae sp. FL0255]